MFESLSNRRRISVAVLAATMLLTGCGAKGRAGNGFISSEGDCIEFAADVYLPENTTVYIGGADLSISSDTDEISDALAVTNIGNGTLELSEAINDVTVSGYDSTVNGDSLAVDLSKPIGDGSGIIVAEDDGSTLKLGIDPQLRKNGTVALNIVQNC